MSLSRRKTLALLGGGFLSAATGAFAYDVTRTPTRALEPWTRAGRYDDVRMNAFSWAILAPNPHNQQPWILDLGTPNEAVLTVNPDQLLPHTDPFNRQITIGLGCFLELARMAALEDGYEMQIDLFPDGSDAAALDGRPVARCTFSPTDAPRDPLFAHVLQRRSLKEPYDLNRPVAQSVVDVLAKSGLGATEFGATLDPARIETLRKLSVDALMVELNTPRTLKESVDVFRIGRREIDATPDGIDFSGPLFETLARTGMFTRENNLDTESSIFREGVKAVETNAMTAMGFVWLTTANNSREAQIGAGADWIRLNLAATAQGLGTQPMSQALQEYPEMDALFTQVHQDLAPNGGTLQMFARIGYGPEVGPSPRWDVQAKVRNV